MRKEGRGGTMLASVHRRSRAATKQKGLGDDCVCGFRSRMVPTGLGCETWEDAGSRSSQINGMAVAHFETGLRPHQPCQWTVVHGTIPDVRRDGSVKHC